MDAESLDALNDVFAIGGHVAVEAGEAGDGLTRVVVHNRLADAEVYLHGAHVASFCPRGAEPVLWMSPSAEFCPGRAIRGGVPIVFPWFGPHPDDPGKPQHGFARVTAWQLAQTAALAGGHTQVCLRLYDDERTRALWPHAFELELLVTVGGSLEIALGVRNTGRAPFTVGAALHTYLAVGDIAHVAIDGLSGLHYVDTRDGGRRKRQDGVVVVDGEVDRVYLDTSGTCVVDDAVRGRRILLSQTGSRSTVVWNPWEEKARRMADFPDDAYRRMVCVEAVNTAGDAPVVEPGGRHTLTQTISVEPGP